MTNKRFLAIDFHCHGIGRFDFAEPEGMVLDELEASLSTECVRSILTLYLPRQHFAAFERFVAEFDIGRRAGRYRHILGIALEGPVLASFGGTPEKGCWHPTRDEWRRIAALGTQGLVYVVISPDAEFADTTDQPPSVQWVVDALLSRGVKPALGHFRKTDPERSAAAIERLCEHVKALGMGPIFTDHLFNDMPLNFKHSWRKQEEMQRRNAEIADSLSADWTLKNARELLGPVPATLVRYAREGVLKICMNFDGEHVDIAICKKAVALVGAENLMLMTDRIQSTMLGGQPLHRVEGNSLLYQARGIVAGGTQSMLQQIGNMLDCGIAPSDIVAIAGGTAALALNLNLAELNQSPAGGRTDAHERAVA